MLTDRPSRPSLAGIVVKELERVSGREGADLGAAVGVPELDPGRSGHTAAKGIGNSFNDQVNKSRSGRVVYKLNSMII